MKEIDLTGQVPIIGGEKEKWLFRCASCGYEAVFILWRGQGMSTACEKCKGDMERMNRVVIGQFEDPEKSGECQVRKKTLADGLKEIEGISTDMNWKSGVKDE